MIEREIVVTVAGHPKTKGSMRCIGQVGKRKHVLIEQLAGAKPWRDALVGWFRKVTQHAIKGEPVGIEATSTIARPQTHYGTGRNAGVLKDRFEQAYPVGHNTGDVDKLARLVLDALQDAKVMPDDCQVVELTTRKAYVDGPGVDVLDHPGVLVRIYPIEVP